VDRERVDIAVKSAYKNGIVSYGWRGPDYTFRFESPYLHPGRNIDSVEIPI